MLDFLFESITGAFSTMNSTILFGIVIIAFVLLLVLLYFKCGRKGLPLAIGIDLVDASPLDDALGMTGVGLTVLVGLSVFEAGTIYFQTKSKWLALLGFAESIPPGVDFIPGCTIAKGINCLMKLTHKNKKVIRKVITYKRGNPRTTGAPMGV